MPLADNRARLAHADWLSPDRGTLGPIVFIDDRLEGFGAGKEQVSQGRLLPNRRLVRALTACPTVIKELTSLGLYRRF